MLSVSQEGRNRKDNAYPHALVEVGNLAVITSSFGIGIDFECTYPTTIQMDAKKELHELIVTGLNEGSGKLDAGFNLDIDKDVVYLGGRISAEVTWSLQGFAKGGIPFLSLIFLIGCKYLKNRIFFINIFLSMMKLDTVEKSIRLKNFKKFQFLKIQIF